MNTSDPIDNKLTDALIRGARREGDHLVLSDEVLRAALDGSRRLTPGEAQALQASPLTLRRLRHLSSERRRAAAENAWHGSAGMLRAAAAAAPLDQLVTDDGWWRLHFIEDDGVWRAILALDAGAPFAARLLRAKPMLRVLDGAGAIVLHGRLDADGECEIRWPFELPPAAHFQLFGARFTVEPAV